MEVDLLTFHQMRVVVLACKVDRLGTGATQNRHSQTSRGNYHRRLDSTYLIEIELSLPLWVRGTACPVVDELIPNTIALVNVVDELDNLRVFRLVQVHIWGTVWVVCWHDELKANWSLLVVNLNWHLASDL